ncbi:MAG TPA: hypothetical protein VK529_06865 [Gemmatimonadaceae bacterium]|nr:hypothetical protein [Gemmatimonadaceae bacterium]
MDEIPLRARRRLTICMSINRISTTIASAAMETRSRWTEKMKSTWLSGTYAMRRRVVDAVLDGVCTTV